jgi:hypothetical protein
MELISLFGAGITIYCGWISVRDDLRGWRRYRSVSGQSVEKSKGGKSVTHLGELCSFSCSRL